MELDSIVKERQYGSETLKLFHSQIKRCRVPQVDLRGVVSLSCLNRHLDNDWASFSVHFSEGICGVLANEERWDVY